MYESEFDSLIRTYGFFKLYDDIIQKRLIELYCIYQDLFSFYVLLYEFMFVFLKKGIYFLFKNTRGSWKLYPYHLDYLSKGSWGAMLL